MPASRENTVKVGDVICDSDIVRKISFTGSTRIGKLLYEKSANTVKNLSLEVGGNAPFLVFNSADVKLAARKAVQSRFRNTGQTCVCVERVFVQEGVYEEFLEELKSIVEELKLGDPLDNSTTQSALINQRSIDSILSKTHKRKPTIIADCRVDMKCFREEIFGPVIPIIKFKDETKAITMANSHPSGLAGYVMSKDIAQIWRVSEALEVGMVGVNEQALSCDTYYTVWWSKRVWIRSRGICPWLG